MIRRTRRCIGTVLLVALLSPGHRAAAQGFGAPLTVQGLDRATMLSAASRAAGGTTLAMRDDITLMFASPAALQDLKGLQLSLGGRASSSTSSQTQQYAPAKYYPNFSLVMEGLTGLVPDTKLDTTSVHTARDSVQRPFDAIGPNWSHNSSKTRPIQVMAAVPFTLGGVQAVAGLGAVEYADLDWYYKNNNVLSPEVNVQRPVPVPLVKNDSLSLAVYWSQAWQKREGSLYGYGAALSFALTGELSVGVSGMLLKGSSDDEEVKVGRGNLEFYTSYFRLDSVYARTTSSGTSDYSGQEYTLSGIYRGRYLSLGLAVKPPTTITRTYAGTVWSDSGGRIASVSTAGEDRIRLPWRGTAGLSLAIARDLRIGLEYEIRSYASAVYTGPDGAQSSPWLSSSLLHFGAEYTPLPWLALRAGVREQAEVFQPEGSALDGEPVTCAVYSGGCGLSYAGMRLDVTYEYSRARYTDTFANNVNLNADARHNVLVSLSFSPARVSGD